MSRTTVSAVQGIIETDAAISLAPFIEAASALVTARCATPYPDYTAAELELIERWLAAHVYCARDPRTSSESAGISASYQSSVSLGLDNSQYGQMAKSLDWHGGLARADAEMKSGAAGRKIRMSWLGTPQASQEAS